jgi:hypothetical protein
MLDSFKMLFRVKELREEKCMRAVQAKRNEVLQAEMTVRAAYAAMQRSAATLLEREDGIYSEIIREVVGLPKLERIKARVKEMEKQHQKLVDDLERAMHVHENLQQALEALREEHRNALIVRDKYQMTKDLLETEAKLEIESAEEAELEEVSTRQPMVAL